ncbi:hypothetical protein DLJ47_10630, partial [Micromonospora sp. S4605]|uniref:hypothetical protein n=1 Tax=Micromonospora sp. S4605 TaxID=1420897 RepID=UPI000D86020E
MSTLPSAADQDGSALSQQSAADQDLLPLREPAAADLARTAARAAGDLLAPPTPVRLGDVVPA